MTPSDIAVLVAAVVACLAGLVVAGAAVVLVGQVRRLERGIEALRAEVVPLAADARRAADHALTELARVDAVLADTEAVTSTVDAAARFTQRTLASPVVKLLALRAGTVGGFRRLREPAGAHARSAGDRAAIPARAAQSRSTGGRHGRPMAGRATSAAGR